MIYQGYDDKFRSMEKRFGDCAYCNNTGKVETDNKGPIASCSTCQPPEDSQ